MTIQYPTTELLHLEQDAQAVSGYLRALNDSDTGPAEAKKLMFQIGLRLLRIESEAKAIGRFLDVRADEVAPA